MRLARRTAAALVVLALAGTAAGCSSAPPSAPPAPPEPTVSASLPESPSVGPGGSGPTTAASGNASGPATPSTPIEGPTGSTPDPPENFPDADRLAFPRATTDLPTVVVAELPAQAVATLRLIKDGGPFPYPQDGAIFQNREGELPDQPSGFYHEFTVPTPGSPDRGPRRIVSGADGALFWTTDHYRSFREIIEPWT